MYTTDIISKHKTMTLENDCLQGCCAMSSGRHDIKNFFRYIYAQTEADCNQFYSLFYNNQK